MSEELRLETRVTRARTGELLRLAWPAVLSYSLNNAYRINDQFWIQHLGKHAQSAVGATFFLQVLVFAFTFLAVGGTLALVSRAVGAVDPLRRDAFTRVALGLGLAIGATSTVVGLALLGPIVGMLDLAPEPAQNAREYLGWIFTLMVPMALLPVVDSIFIGRGLTRVPMLLQAISVCLNYALNPLLVYGKTAAEVSSAPGAALAARLGELFDFEGLGIGGAGLATGISRATAVGLGLLILTRYLGVRILPRADERARLGGAASVFERALAIVRVSAPSSLSIAVYAVAYVLLLRYVLTPLGTVTIAGLGIGFQVFEGVAFPCYLGISIAASSLVGREIGARNELGVREVIGSARFAGRIAGLAFAALFWFGGPVLVPFFTDDPEVASATLAYVRTLAFSQYFVAVETVNEKILLGSGQTRPILWISSLGNLLRVPLGMLLTQPGLALGARGVWWAINLSTVLKAGLFWRQVQAGRWLHRSLGEERARLAQAAS